MTNVWQKKYDSWKNTNFTFNFSIIGNFDISHITHISYHHPRYIAKRGPIKRINDSFHLNIIYKHGGDEHDLYRSKKHTSIGTNKMQQNSKTCLSKHVGQT
jgi:hypothetical protein